MKVQMRDGSGWRKYNRVVEDVDRHGNVRVYYRSGKGKPKIRLTSTPGTAEFETEYHRARNGELSPGPSLSKAGRPIAALEKEGWCPGAELNHRHTDFQSALLSYNPLFYNGHVAKLASLVAITPDRPTPVRRPRTSRDRPPGSGTDARSGRRSSESSCARAAPVTASARSPAR
jgi:hypothetical protein